MQLNRRLVLSLGLLAMLLLVSAALATWWGPAAGPGGAYDVTIEGPDGILFAGTVAVDEATALSVLEAAAGEAGLALETETYPGMGTYVRAVGEHRAHGPDGWVYEVRRDGAWTLGDRSAARYALEEGDAVRWRWTSDGV